MVFVNGIGWPIASASDLAAMCLSGERPCVQQLSEFPGLALSFRRVLAEEWLRHQYRLSILGRDTQIVLRLKLLRCRTAFLFYLGFVLRLFFLGFPHG